MRDSVHRPTDVGVPTRPGVDRHDLHERFDRPLWGAVSSGAAGLVLGRRLNPEHRTFFHIGHDVQQTIRSLAHVADPLP